MKKDLVAVIFFFLCPLTVLCFTQKPPSSDDNWFGRCTSEYYSLIECAQRNFDPFVAVKGGKISVDSECCKVIEDFDRACGSKSERFEDLLYSFLWMKDSCGSSTPPTSSSASPTPPSHSPSPPSSPSSPTPPSSNQTSSLFDPPEALPLPDHVRGHAWFCGTDNAAINDVERCWERKKDNSTLCCDLTRSMGMDCDTGKPFDTVSEVCCVIYKDPAKPRIRCENVKPRYMAN